MTEVFNLKGVNVVLSAKSQVTLVALFAIDIYKQMKFDPDFSFSQYAFYTYMDSPLGEKKIANTISVSKKVIRKFEPQLSQLGLSENDVNKFASFLTTQSSVAGYRATLDDLSNWLSNRPSTKSRSHK